MSTFQRVVLRPFFAVMLDRATNDEQAFFDVRVAALSPHGRAGLTLCSMDAGRWFGTAHWDGASPEVGETIKQLLTMLDAVQPAALDRQRSHIVNRDHDWPEYEVEILLAHRDDDDGDVTLAIGKAGAVVSWLTTHDHVYPQDGSSERPWTTVAVDAVAALLRGEYEVEEHYRGGTLIKTTVRDLVEGGRAVTTTGSLLTLLLPFRRGSRRVERRSVSFDCRE